MAVHMTRQGLLSLVAAGSVGIGGLAGLSAVRAGTPVSIAQPRPGVEAPAAQIDVRLRPWLAQQTAARSEHLRVAYAAGITPAAIAAAQGFQDAEIGALMAVVNGSQVDLTAPLNPGDKLELISGMAGG
jgi:molybdopterin converting factor small subunit